MAKNLRHLWIWGASAGANKPGLKMETVLEPEWPSLTQLRLENLALEEDGVHAVIREAVKRKWHAVHVHSAAAPQDGMLTALEMALAGNLQSLSLSRDCDLNEPPQPVPDGGSYYLPSPSTAKALR